LRNAVDRLACLLRKQSRETLDDCLKVALRTPLARFAAGL
jgi:hypothetical protein